MKKMWLNVCYFFSGVCTLVVMVSLLWLNVIYTPEIQAGIGKFPANVLWFLFSAAVFLCLLLLGVSSIVYAWPMICQKRGCANLVWNHWDFDYGDYKCVTCDSNFR